MAKIHYGVKPDIFKYAQKMAKVSTVTAGSITLGVAAGPRQFIADQLLATADVIRAMHERAALNRPPLGVIAVQFDKPRKDSHRTKFETSSADWEDDHEGNVPAMTVRLACR